MEKPRHHCLCDIYKEETGKRLTEWINIGPWPARYTHATHIYIQTNWEANTLQLPLDSKPWAKITFTFFPSWN